MSNLSTTTKPRRRWLRFSLRTGFIALTVVGLMLASGLWWHKWVYRASLLAERINSRGGYAQTLIRRPESSFKFLLPEFVPYIHEVSFEDRQFTDDDLMELSGVPHLKDGVLLNGTSITVAAQRQFFGDPAAAPPFTSFLRPSDEAWTKSELKCTNALPLILDHEQLLRWQLTCARLNDDAAAEKQAYEHCLSGLRSHWQPHPSIETIDNELFAARVALLEMQIARQEQNSARLTELNSSWEDRARRLPSIAWPCDEHFAQVVQVEEFLLATRLARELRAEMADSRHARAAKLQASDDAIARLDLALREMMYPSSLESQEYLHERWIWAVVIASETEKRQRAAVAVKAISLDEDEQSLRRLGKARAAIISQMLAEADWQLWERLSRPLEVVDRLIFEASRRQPEAPLEDPQFEQEYSENLKHLIAFSQLGHYRMTIPMTVYLQLRHERDQLPILSLKQYEIEALIKTGTARAQWSAPHQTPTADDWRKEYARESKDKISKTPSFPPRSS